MSRLSRRNRTAEDLGIKSKGGMLDLFDNAMKEAYRITDDEYDYIAMKIKDEEMDIIFKENKSFSDKRNCLQIIGRYIREKELNEV